MTLLEKKQYREFCLQLAESAAKDLAARNRIDFKTKLKRNVRQYVLRQKQAPIDAYSWPKALLAEGLMETYLCLGEKFCLEAVQNYVDSWIAEGQKIHYVDNCMNGDIIYKLNKEIPFEKYGIAMQKTVDWLKKECPKEYDGSFRYRIHNPKMIFADTIGMVVPFLIEFGKKEKKAWLEMEGLDQIRAFWRSGMDEKSGLPYHGYIVSEKKEPSIIDKFLEMVSEEKTDALRMGIIGWGRAVGWIMTGMADGLSEKRKTDLSLEEDQVVEENFEKLEKKFRLLAETVVEYQRPDGYFSWQLPAMEGPADTSATAMIAYALERGIRCGKLPSKYHRYVEKAAAALASSVKDGRVYNCSGECEGFAQYPQVYGAYPWSLGPTLRLFALLAEDSGAQKERPKRK